MKLIIKRITFSFLAILCLISGSLIGQAEDTDEAEEQAYSRRYDGRRYDGRRHDGRGRHGKSPWWNIENKETNNLLINNKTNYGFKISLSTREMVEGEGKIPSRIPGKRVYRNLLNEYRRGTMKDFRVTGPGAVTDVLGDSVFGLAGTQYVIELEDTEHKFASSSLKQTGRFEWKGGNSMTKTLVFPKAQKSGDRTKDSIKVYVEINYNNGRIDILLSPIGY